ncbi:MAG: LamG domain-containing protein [Candidatus Omnitrophica bacterium]|nr:LamG domain-containing protein [Candidatus Omnitrophota bacterium]
MTRLIFLFLMFIVLISSGIAEATMTENETINAYRFQEENNKTVSNMHDGFVDVYIDGIGIDESSSSNVTLGGASVLLLHGDGEDAATSIENDGTNTGSITFNGNAELDTAQQKWGPSSIYFDGTGDYLTIPDSSDWDIFADANADWTIDFWVKHTDHANTEYYFSHFEADNYTWLLRHQDGTGILFYAEENGSTQVSLTGGEITDTSWHHIAAIKKGNEYGVYLDGTQVSYTSSSNTVDHNGTLYIGQRGDGIHYLDGHMDEIRIVKANVFGASPNASKTDSITVPDSAHTSNTVVSGSSSFYTGLNMNLVSEVFTAEAVPTDIKVTIFEEDVDALTVNTDIDASVSRDGGSSWTTVTLTDEGDLDSNMRILSGSASVTGQSSGSSVQYQITTDNDKESKIHGIGVSWE